MTINFNSRFTERFLIFFNVLMCAITGCTVLIEFLSKDTLSANTFSSNFLIILPYLLYILVLEIIYIFIMQVFVNSGTKLSFHARTLPLFLILSVVISYFLKEIFNGLYLFIFTLFQYILTSTLYNSFVLHDNFEKVCENKKGLELQSTLAKDKYVAQEFVQNIETVKSILIVVSIILSGLVIVTTASFPKKAIIPYICTFIYIISSFGIYQLLSIYEREIYYAFLGFDKVFDLRTRIFYFSMVIVLICLLAGLLLSSNNQILKKEYFQWFFDLFKHKKSPIHFETTPPPPVLDVEVDAESARNFQRVIQEKPNAIVKFIVEVIQYSIIAGIIFWVFSFLLKPLFDKSLAIELGKHNFKKLMSEFFKKVREMFRELFGKKREFTPYATVGTQSFKFQMNDMLGKTKKSKEKKAELDRLTKEFIKVISWGEQKQIMYKKSQAPAEYTEVLFNQTHIDYLKKIGFLFEKALYSKDLLSKDEEKEYKDCIQKVLQTE